jgi:hypothetical protein
MPYLGNTPTTQSFISGTDYFNGTGAQTAFTLSRTVVSVNDVEAVVNNVVQRPNDAYTISGTTITFTSAPSSGTQNVYVRYLSTTTQSISPSSGVSISAATGTVSAPSYSFIGNSNTGIYSPATDTIAFSEGGVESMRINSSGNVGIGTSSPLGKFDVGGASTATVNTGIYVHGTDNASYGQFVAFRRNGSNSLIIGDAGAIAGSGGGNSIFYTYGANYQAFWTNGTERMRITSDGLLQFNSGYGSVATAYGCRAWVNFNGTGTVAIRGSGNVTSITDNGTGDYTVNITTAMPDTNYSVNAIGYADNVSYNLNMYLTEATAPTASLFRVVSRQTNTTTTFDSARVYLAVFR